MDKKLIGQRLKSFLKERFGTIEKGAEQIGTTASSLSNSYINGKSVPGGELLAKLSELGCDINWLLTGEKKAPGSSSWNVGSIKQGDKSYSGHFENGTFSINEEQTPYLNDYIDLLRKRVKELEEKLAACEKSKTQ